MTSKKRTFSLPEELSQRLDQAAGGNASAFVAEALEDRLDRQEFLGRLDELWGPLDPEALAWARERLGAVPPESHRAS